MLLTLLLHFQTLQSDVINSSFDLDDKTILYILSRSFHVVNATLLLDPWDKWAIYDGIRAVINSLSLQLNVFECKRIFSGFEACVGRGSSEGNIFSTRPRCSKPEPTSTSKRWGPESRVFIEGRECERLSSSLMAHTRPFTHMGFSPFRKT